jgi:3-deoxy-manno-octulosonate cytidylyltransferase (CMP-KDO synthetase)
MVQGDEILMTPAMAEAIVESYRNGMPPVVNLASPLTRNTDHDDPNTVKLVATPDDHVLYFSRAAIPSRSRTADVPAFQQTGVMGFSAAFLVRFGRMPQTPLEIIESVDMMRVIENRLPLKVVFSDSETIGVDTEADRRRAENLLRDDALTHSYLELKT